MSRELFSKCALKVQSEYGMGGLAGGEGGLYEDFAWDVHNKYVAALESGERTIPQHGQLAIALMDKLNKSDILAVSDAQAYDILDETLDEWRSATASG